MLQAALIAAPLVIQGASILFGVAKKRKVNKKVSAEAAQVTADSMKQAAALKAQVMGSLGSISGGFTGPSGIATSGAGIGPMQGGPPFLQR